ncbi:Serine/threonine-protein kinase Nek7 isoform X2 [Aphelenchoides fujianensis]|nr:Serine/threonine-protein kinase Nek7 isoform X2 [Aphelenchoides fujianensis]
MAAAYRPPPPIPRPPPLAMSSANNAEVEWPEEVSGYEKERDLSVGLFPAVILAHVRGAVRQKAVMKAIGLTGLHDARERLCRAEVQALQQLDHPHIVKCYASIEDEDSQERARSVLVLEFASRGNLEQLITDTYFTKRKRLPEKQIWRLFAQIAAAIAHVHERGILHRDLKPAHVLLDAPQMTVKVCDFTLCRLFLQNTVRSKTRVGTPHYLSPERAARSDYNFASDVWSMGCILYEMTSGRSPFGSERSNEFALYRNLQTADFPPLPDAERRTPHLKLLVRLCLQVDHSRRPSAAQVQRFAEKMARRCFAW